MLLPLVDSFSEDTMKFKYFLLPLVYVFFTGHLSSKEAVEKEPEKKKILEEKSVEIKHSLTIQGQKIDYKSVAGTLLLMKNEEPNASFFYTAYFKEQMEESSIRPITFCFNGGPGSASVWLHLGAFGPQKVAVNENGNGEPPYHLEDNPHSLLDVTDLVFIDPMSTGYSKTACAEDCKEFHGVEQDIKSIAEFIRLFTTKYERWLSPKFIAGESYGTTRAAGLAAELHDKYFLYINGVMLISSVLDFQTMHDFKAENDLAYILLLPTYAATAHYHQLLKPELQNKPLKDFLNEVKKFALGAYALALLQGDVLEDNLRNEVEQKFSAYTGLSETYVHNANLRVQADRFRKELMRSKRRCIGRFDSRFVGVDSDPLAAGTKSDPSMEAVCGPFAAAFNHYIRSELGWKQDERYEILANVSPWDWKVKNAYLNVAPYLKDVMSKNRQLKVFIASGYYDLATPFFATEYTFDHLYLDPSLAANITMEYYDAGHMMYIHPSSLVKLNNDIRAFIYKTLP